MSKPIDRLSPHCTDAWSNMEEWGGKSWFPKDGEKEEKNGNASQERYPESGKLAKTA